MVGDEVITESLDGEDWEAFDNDLEGRCVAFAEDTFLAGGRRRESDGNRYSTLLSTLLSSQDGREWISEAIPQKQASVISIVYGDGTWLAATSGQRVLRKTDDGPWESSELALRSPKLTFGGGYFYSWRTKV